MREPRERYPVRIRQPAESVWPEYPRCTPRWSRQLRQHRVSQSAQRSECGCNSKAVGTTSDTGAHPSNHPKSLCPYVPIITKTPFSAVLPGLKNYAVKACRSSGEVPIDTSLTDPREHFSFMKDLDDRTANRLAADLGDCEGQLFRELIRVIRNGEGRLISSSWVKETVAGYRPPPDTSSGNYTPPRNGGNRGEGSGNSNEPSGGGKTRVWDPLCNCWTVEQ